MTDQVKFKDLIEGERYTLVGPVVSPVRQGVIDKLIAAPHMLDSSRFGSLRFMANPEDREENYNSNENNGPPRMAPGVQFLDIHRTDLPEGEDQLFEIDVPQKSVKYVTEEKATNIALRNIMEAKTNQSAAPGKGPANLVRAFAGLGAKGAKGGKRSRKRSKKSKSRKNKKYKRTRSRRN